MPSSHLTLCRPLFLLPPIPPSNRVFSNESTLCMRWPKYWSFSFSIIPSKEILGLIFRMDCLDLLIIDFNCYILGIIIYPYMYFRNQYLFEYIARPYFQISIWTPSASGQFSRVQLFATPWTAASRPHCPPTPRVFPNSCPSSRWCHPTILSLLSPSPPALNLSQHQGPFK